MSNNIDRPDPKETLRRHLRNLLSRVLQAKREKATARPSSEDAKKRSRMPLIEFSLKAPI